jgi:hypothetical protein
MHGGNFYLAEAISADFCGPIALRPQLAASVANMPHLEKSVRLAEKMPNSGPNDAVCNLQTAGFAGDESVNASVPIVPCEAAGL